MMQPQYVKMVHTQRVYAKRISQRQRGTHILVQVARTVQQKQISSVTDKVGFQNANAWITSKQMVEDV